MSEATVGKYQCAVCLQWIEGPSWQHVCAGSAPTTGGLAGWTCRRCGVSVPNGVVHACGLQPGVTVPVNATGWECPRCHLIHASWVQVCSCRAATIPYGPVYCSRCGRQGANLRGARRLCETCEIAVRDSTAGGIWPQETSGGVSG